ncbi:MAG: hypothetical protein ABFC38_00405 [Methanospirillum sp.]
MTPSIHDLLTVIPYRGETAEYAWEVRKAISALGAEDLVIAVDFPEGYEERVLRAVKDLPRVSLLIDPLKRGIPVIPTHPGIEAVRCYLEWGLDLLFVDAGLPLCGTSNEVDHFLEMVRARGLDDVVGDAEGFGIDLNRVLGLSGAPTPAPKDPPFSDSPAIAATVYGMEQLEEAAAYFDARHRYMASRLLRPLQDGRRVVLVCHAKHEAGVRAYLEQEAIVPPAAIHIPTTRCRVREVDIPLITSEIPFCIYLYELYRDLEPDRRTWIERICTEAAEDDSAATLRTVFGFAENLALSSGLMAPDLASLVCASAACASPDYTLRLWKAALSYPPADRESNCVIVPHFDPNFTPRRIEMSRDLVRTLDWVRRQAEARKRSPRSSILTTFDRTAVSLRHEREFMRYLTPRYLSLQPSGESAPVPFSSGIRDGVDIRETLRNHWTGEIYVREGEQVNDAAYVFYFGGDPTWRVYFDRQHSMVGTARRDGNTFSVISLVAFNRTLPTRTIMDEVHIWDPLGSSLDVALRYCRHVFLFAYDRPNTGVRGREADRIRWIPLALLPNAIRQKVQFYDVV